MAYSSTELSFWQKLDLVPAVIQCLCQTLLTSVAWPLLGDKAPTTLKKHVFFTLTRNLFARFSIEQLQFVAGSTELNYTEWTRSQKLPFHSVHLPHANAKAFWIGNPQADTIILYYHGGGFVLPASQAHFTMISRLIAYANESQKSVSGLILHYDLAPARRYPHQVMQCVELLRYALTELQKSPDQIILAGESSGGNLVFSILSHLMHPHPSIKPLEISRPLKAAFVSSPVVKFGFTDGRFSTNEIFDPMSGSTLQRWSSTYLGPSAEDAWNNPGQNEAEWWNRLRNVVAGMLFTISTDEIMADDAQDLVENITSVYSGLTSFSSKNDTHGELAIGPLGGLEECEAAKLIKSWVTERI